jgi:hypothetical protein
MPAIPTGISNARIVVARVLETVSDINSDRMVHLIKVFTHF